MENFEEEENYFLDEVVNKIFGLFFCLDGFLLLILLVIISFLKIWVEIVWLIFGILFEGFVRKLFLFE